METERSSAERSPARASAPRRDLAVPVLVGLLAVAALPSAGLWPGTLPTEPGTYVRVALAVAALFAVLVGPFLRGTSPWRILALLVAALPFLAYGVLETPAPPEAAWVPGPGVLTAGVLAIVLAALRGSMARLGAILLCALIIGDVVLASAGLPILPAAWNPLRAPAVLRGEEPSAFFRAPDARPPRPGWRVGAPVPALDPPALLGAPTDGPFFVPASEGRYPTSTLLVLVADPAHEARAEPDLGWLVPLPTEPETVGPALAAADAVVVPPGAPTWGTAGRAIGDAIVAWVRGGGLLVGPAPGRPWPEPLGRLLGPAGRSWESGVQGGKTLGLGLVGRAGSEVAVRSLIQEGLARPRLGTIFDRQGGPVPPLPPALPPWKDDAPARRAQGLLLLVYALTAAALDRIARGAVPRALGLVAPALAVLAGLLWTSPAAPTARLHALRLDLGGGGGRRVEAVAIAASPVGWAGPVTWQGTGVLSVRGARLDAAGRVRVRPGRTAWVIRERAGWAAGGAERESRRGGFLRTFLRGPVDPHRLVFLRARPPAVSVGDLTIPEAWLLRVR